MRVRLVKIFLLAAMAAVFCAIPAYAAAGFVDVICGELEKRGGGLRHVYDETTKLNVFYDEGAYDAVYRMRGDEAFAQWYGRQSLASYADDLRDGVVAVVFTAQRLDGILSPKIAGHQFGFLETHGVVLMGRGAMIVFDDPWGTVGRFLGGAERVEYATANIGDEGGAFICASRRYKNSAFAGLVQEMKRAARQKR